MTDTAIIFLPGAGGGGMPTAVRTDGFARVRYEPISYPSWQRYAVEGFSPAMLIDELTTAIAARVPQGPIHIVGNSIGGHFGYMVALALQARGREIGGFCAIDTFMIRSAAPSPGWRGRALARGAALLRRRRVRDFGLLLRSLLWRALLRLPREQLPKLLGRYAAAGRLPWPLRLDAMFASELSIRLLIREMAPWIASLDRTPVALHAPTILLRTRLTATDDAAWRRRCPSIEIIELPGDHHSLLEPENVDAFRHAFLTATQNWR